MIPFHGRCYGSTSYKPKSYKIIKSSKITNVKVLDNKNYYIKTIVLKTGSSLHTSLVG